jgi:hypothetical protein
VSDPGEYNIVAAAKELGLKVIEFQHGFIDRYHTAYSWSAYALPYKASMPIPDRIFLYGVHWQQELTANGFWREELCPVGSLRMDQYRKIKAMNKGGKEEDVYTIVLTTQGMDVEGVIAFVSDFLAAASGQLNYRLYIRLHPDYETDKSPYVGAFRTNNHVQVLLGNEQPSTFELLTRAHLHLSISSTCHYDALGLGVPTVILPFVTHEIILPLHKAGHAFLVQTPQELVNIALQCKNYVVPDKVVELYFKPGALENMKRELGV